MYLAAGLRLLPGFVKLNSFLQQVESFKPSLNLISNELKEQNIYFSKHNNLNFEKMIYLGDITCQNINYSYGKKKQSMYEGKWMNQMLTGCLHE